MTQHEEYTKKDLKRMLIYTGILVVVIVITAIFLAPISFPLGLIFFILLTGVGVFLYCRWFTKTYSPFALRCPECGHEFEVSSIRFFFSPTVGPFKKGETVKKYFKCPKCEKSSAKIALKMVKK